MILTPLPGSAPRPASAGEEQLGASHRQQAWKDAMERAQLADWFKPSAIAAGAQRQPQATAAAPVLMRPYPAPVAGTAQDAQPARADDAARLDPDPLSKPTFADAERDVQSHQPAGSAAPVSLDVGAAAPVHPVELASESGPQLTPPAASSDALAKPSVMSTGGEQRTPVAGGTGAPAQAPDAPQVPPAEWIAPALAAQVHQYLQQQGAAFDARGGAAAVPIEPGPRLAQPTPAIPPVRVPLAVAVHQTPLRASPASPQLDEPEEAVPPGARAARTTAPSAEAAHEDVRVHVDIGADGACVWLGLDRSRLASLPGLARHLEKWLRASGVRLSMMVCNGRPVPLNFSQGDLE